MTTTRILLVDDNEDHRFFIRRALEAEGDDIVIDVAVDGAEALDSLYQRGGFEDRPRPHLMLLDLRMPRVDGLAVIEQVKGDPDLRSIPITVLSSSARPEDVNGSFRNGGNSYVVKPASLGAMRDELQAVRQYWTEVSMLPDPPA